MLRGARAVRRLGLCTTPLGIAAVARNASCAPGYGSEALRCRSVVRRQWDELVSAREDTRAGIYLLQARPSKALRAPADTPHPPQGGFERAPQHNARIIMRRCCARHASACRADHLFGSRPHNVRYVGVPAQRAKTLAVRSGEAPQISSPARPLMLRIALAHSLLCTAPHPPPQGAPCLVASRLGFASDRSHALHAASSAASAPTAEDGACHGHCKPERLSGVFMLGGSPVDEGRGSMSPSSTGERR